MKRDSERDAWSLIKKLLVTVAVMGTGSWAADKLLRWRHQATDSSDEVHFATTDDDVRIALFRHRPSGGGGEPVLLVHGLGVNHYHMDLDEQFSIARYLRDRGFDCWCIELRGRGESETPGRSWNFDDYAKRDIPAAIDFILEQTGFSRLHWIGHSMGGMLYYAVAGGVGYQDKIRSAVSIGGPFHGQRKNQDQPTPGYPFGPNGSGYTTLFVPVLDLLRRLQLPWPVIARWGSVAYSGLKHGVPEPLIQIMVNPNNITDKTLRRAAVRDVVRVEAGVLAQFLQWGIERHWVDGTGDLNYRQAVSDITVPTLLIAGNADNMVPVHNNQSGFDQLASSDKELIVAGRENGFRADYSHVDLVYGHHVRDEIFPPVTDWFQSHPAR